MGEQQYSHNIELTPFDNRRLLSLCGKFNENIRHIESRFKVEILSRGNTFQINGPQKSSLLAKQVLESLYDKTRTIDELTAAEVHLSIQEFSANANDNPNHSPTKKLNTMDETKFKARNNADIKLKSRTPDDGKFKSKPSKASPRSKSQEEYIKNITSHPINFGIGPAGTGKTFLAVACAVNALEQNLVSRIILVRPVVEAGEHLGFLPGDVSQKIDPYLRPLYDSLYELLGFEKVYNLINNQVIEIAPLAYMRGRTLNDAFIILDESQNTTVEQMKMFLTRLGFSSVAVITGDVTQVDLPRGKQSGLYHANRILQNVEEISFTYFNSSDVVRHPVVQQIINAYDAADRASAAAKTSVTTEIDPTTTTKVT